MRVLAEFASAMQSIFVAVERQLVRMVVIYDNDPPENIEHVPAFLLQSLDELR